MRDPIELDKRKSMGPARRRRILERHGNVCAYPDCEVSEALEVDNMIALARGDKASDENLEGLCRHHHAQKTRRDIKLIAKAKRIVRKDNPSDLKASRLQSRGFQNNLTKRFDGTVVPRKGK